MRGVACVLLVAFHVIGDTAQAGIRVADDSGLRWFADSFAYIRMPLFSFLAGLVYAWRPIGSLGGWPSFMIKKVRRLLIPLLIFVPLIGLAQTLVPAANAAPHGSWWQWYISPLPPYWFLLAAFWLFCLIGLLDGLGWLRSKPAVLAAIVLAGAASLAFGPGDQLYYILAIGSAVFLLPFFLAGVLVSRFDWISVSRPVRLTAVAVAVVLFLVAQYTERVDLDHAPGRHTAIGLLLGLAGSLAILWLGWRNRYVAWIGSFSAGIFLVHPFTVAGTRAVLTRVGGSTRTACCSSSLCWWESSARSAW